MTAPTYNDVWEYSRQVQHISQQARNAFLLAAAGVNFNDSAQAASDLRTIIQAVTQTYGLAASTLGAQWFEYCHEKKFDRGYTAIVGEVSRYSVKSDTDLHVDRYFKGEYTDAQLIERLAGVATDQTQKSARDCILDNLNDVLLEQKKTKSGLDVVKYARVPVGESCAFCIMLASRGAVYKSEWTATKTSLGDSYHENCNCTAVPFVEPREIIGYADKLDTYESMYREADNKRRTGDIDRELKEHIAAVRAQHEEKLRKGLATDDWTPYHETCIIMRAYNPQLTH